MTRARMTRATRTWLLLSAAIGLEVVAALSLRAAVDHPAWYAGVVAGYAGAFLGLRRILRLGANVGVVYGVWAAAGVVLTALGGAVLFGEPLTATTAVGIALVVGGVLCVELGAQAAARRSAARTRGTAGATAATAGAPDAVEPAGAVCANGSER